MARRRVELDKLFLMHFYSEVNLYAIIVPSVHRVARFAGRHPLRAKEEGDLFG